LTAVHLLFAGLEMQVNEVPGAAEGVVSSDLPDAD
jgi:hypothetical protein